MIHLTMLAPSLVKETTMNRSSVQGKTEKLR